MELYEKYDYKFRNKMAFILFLFNVLVHENLGGWFMDYYRDSSQSRIHK
jgi:hypothetical protein